MERYGETVPFLPNKALSLAAYVGALLASADANVIVQAIAVRLRPSHEERLAVFTTAGRWALSKIHSSASVRSPTRVLWWYCTQIRPCRQTAPTLHR